MDYFEFITKDRERAGTNLMQIAKALRDQCFAVILPAGEQVMRTNGGTPG